MEAPAFDKQRAQTAAARGYVTLITVLIVGAVAATIAVSLLLSSIGGAQEYLVLETYYQAKASANACAELALQKLADDPAFSASQSENIASGSCSYALESLTGADGSAQQRLKASGAEGDAIHRISVIVTAVTSSTPSSTLVSWHEIADF